MRKLLRPKVHSEFELKVEQVRREVEAAVKAQQEPEYPATWSHFKADFTSAQNGRCGFCEGPVWGLHYGDIEHFRPKSEVSELDMDDPELWGREVVWKSTVVGRTVNSYVAKPGYWWLAYDWRNYLLSCQICNQQWKRTIFPLAIKAGALAPGAERNEQSLLISPFDDFEPSEHFDYGRLGEIMGVSERGRVTILVCGLDRPSLRLARYRTAKAVHEHLDEMAGNITERELLQLLRYVEAFGCEMQHYCGMVRTIFRARSGMRWEELQSLIEVLEGRASLDRHLCDC